MCYRFAYGDIESVQAKYKVILSPDDLARLGDPLNVFPSDYAPVVFSDVTSKNLTIGAFKWGLVPFWAKDAKIGNKMFNARAETLNIKPSFRESFQKMRCLVPVNGFYETWKSGELKKSYYFSSQDNKEFSLAGLYSIWKDVSTEHRLQTFTVVTTQANNEIQSVHDRMPLILKEEEELIWLKEGNDDKIFQQLIQSDYLLRLQKIEKR